MKKRADDKKKKSPEAKSSDIKDASAEVKAEKSKKAAFVIPPVYWYVGLVALVLFSLYLRVILPWKGVFIGSTVMFSSESDAWYHMMLAKSTAINLQRTFYDPMTNFPFGTSIHFGPFVSWGITILSFILGLGRPSLHTVDVVGAYWPALMGTLLILPIFFIGKELGGKACGFVASLLVIVLPGQLFSRTALGFTDHHSSEILLSTTAMLFFLLAVREGSELTFSSIMKKDFASFKRPLLYIVLAGLFMGLYIDAWALGTLFEGILLIFIAAQAVINHIQERDSEYLGVIGAVSLLTAVIMVLPFANSQNGFHVVQYSLFQPTILIMGIIFVLALTFLSRIMRQRGLSRYYYPGSIAAIVLMGFLALKLAAPQFINNLISALFTYLLPRAGGAATVAELSPMLSGYSIQANFPGIALGSIFLSSFWLALIGLALLAIRYFKKGAPGDLLVIVWSLFILAITLVANRSAYYYGVNVAILCAFLSLELVRLLGQKREIRLEHAALGMFLPSLLFFIILNAFASPSTVLVFLATVVLPIALMLLIFDWMKVSLRENMEISAVLLLCFILLVVPSLQYSYVEAKYTSGPNSDWYSSCRWLLNNTPSPGMDIYDIYQRPPRGQQYPYPEAAYGVMSWWDYGHLMETIGHRIPNANPFQQGIGNATAGTPGSSPYFLAESEEEAEKILADLDKNRSIYSTTRYVMPDVEMAFGKFYAMTAWSAIPFSRYASAVYQPQGEVLKPIQIFRQPYFKTMVARLQLFDGSEVPMGDAVAVAYRPEQLEGFTIPVMTDPPKFSSNYTELAEFVNQSKSKGDYAEIASQDQLTPSVPLEALQHYRLVHESEHDARDYNGNTLKGLKWVKTFEHVPGAKITGTAPTGTEVTIAVRIMTNTQRNFIYRQSNISSGEFTLIVPYSTEGSIPGGTQFDTKPIGPYQLLIGDSVYQITVPEEMVISGGVIRV